MLGFVIGIIGGCIEFILLCRFVNMVTFGGKNPVFTVVLKVAVLVCTLLLCAFIVPEQLLPAGIGVVLPIVGGGLVRFIVYMVKKPKSDM